MKVDGCEWHYALIVVQARNDDDENAAAAGSVQTLSQMPVVLIPVHFDRDVMSHSPSCQRSIVLRPFVTADFMTGISAQPGKHISVEASKHILSFCILLSFFKLSNGKGVCRQ